MQILIATANQPLATLITRSLSRFNYRWTQTANGLDAFQKAITHKYDLILMEYDLPRMNSLEVLRRFHALENYKPPPVVVFTVAEEERFKLESEHFARTEVVARPIAIREFVDKVQQILHQSVRVTCLGGGTGLFTLLSGLKTIPRMGLTSIVSMSDDGGSTGRLRDMFGVLPPGDIRRSLVALSTAPDLLNELMQYRFERGGELKGHNVGNLLLTALAEMRGSMTQAVKSIGEILNIEGHVIPVTETQNTLKAELEDGKVLEGEHRIDLFEGRDPNIRIRRIWQEPLVTASPDALEAIYNSRFVILGPGDLFTSIVSNLIVEGIADAICSSKAKVIYICNVMTKPGETLGYTFVDHVAEIVRYLKADCLDYVVHSSTRFSNKAIQAYAKQQQIPVEIGDEKKLKKVTKAKFVSADLSCGIQFVRHDSLKLAAELKRIIEIK